MYIHSSNSPPKLQTYSLKEANNWGFKRLFSPLCLACVTFELFLKAVAPDLHITSWLGTRFQDWKRLRVSLPLFRLSLGWIVITLDHILHVNICWIPTMDKARQSFLQYLNWVNARLSGFKPQCAYHTSGCLTSTYYSFTSLALGSWSVQKVQTTSSLLLLGNCIQFPDPSQWEKEWVSNHLCIT